jgi:hypothetical protein
MAGVGTRVWAQVCTHNSFNVYCNDNNCLEIYFTEVASGGCTAPVTSIQRRVHGTDPFWLSATTLCSNCSSPTTDCTALASENYDYRLITTCDGQDCIPTDHTYQNITGCQ